MNFRFVLFFLALFWALSSGSQDLVVNGKIFSAGVPLAEARVQIGGSRAVSDSSGAFAMLMQPGRYKCIIEAEGFELHVAHYQFEKDTTLYFDLTQQSSKLGEVVVTGTARAVQKLESPVAVEVFSPQFFKKNPAPSVFESLQNINGVRPQVNCSVCNTGDIHINGLEGPYTMITIDGMPIVSSLASVYGLFGIPAQLIERVEIIKGPASGLYGSEAIGGLINIITKSPARAPAFSASVLSTSWQEHNLDLGFRWNHGKKIYSLLGLNYFRFQNKVDDNSDGFTDVPLQERISVFNKWSVSREGGKAASLAFRYFTEDRWGGETRWTKNNRGGDEIYGESIYTNRWELIGEYQLPSVEKILLNASATWHDQDSYYGKVFYKGKQKVLFGQVKWEKPVGNSHFLLAGLAGRHNYYDDNSTATVDTLLKQNRPENYFIPGIFIQDEWKLATSHQLLLGMRLDHHPVHKFIFTPRIAYKYAPDKKQVIRLNAGTGFRVVNLFTEEHAALTGSRAVEVTEDLDPEQSYNVNINYVLKGGRKKLIWSVDASVWYTYFTNQILPDYETDPDKIIYRNLDGFSVSRGFSLNMEWNLLHRFKGMAGITVQDVYRKDKNATPDKLRPMFTESWSGTWLLSYSFPVAGFTIDYTGNVYGPMNLPLISPLDPRRPRSPVWSIQNLQLTKWISQGFEIFGGVKNLLNWTPAKGQPFLIARAEDPFDKNVSHDADGNVLATPDNPYALSFDPAYIYASNQGRRLFAGLRWNIRKKHD